MVYMLTFGVYYIDGKCYHIYPYIAYMDPMGNTLLDNIAP